MQRIRLTKKLQKYCSQIDVYSSTTFRRQCAALILAKFILIAVSFPNDPSPVLETTFRLMTHQQIPNSSDIPSQNTVSVLLSFYFQSAISDTFKPISPFSLLHMQKNRQKTCISTIFPQFFFFFGKLILIKNLKLN